MSISTRLAPLPDKEARTQSLQVITVMMMIMTKIMTIMTIIPQASLSMLNLNLPARVWLPLYAADTPHYIVRWQLGIIHGVLQL